MMKSLKERILGFRGKRSYSQCGEDLIMDFVLLSLGINQPRYLDIGANQARYLSNSYYFYQKGGSGVCVEPDPILYAAFRNARPRDICLNVGVVAHETATSEFYVLSSRTLSTFSKQDADRLVSQGQQKLVQVLNVPCLTVNQILNNYFLTSAPHLVSIDIEGQDLDVLESYDFSRFRPLVICAETLSYTEDKSERKLEEVITYIKSQGYFVYADTYINSIFVDSEAWRKR